MMPRNEDETHQPNGMPRAGTPGNRPRFTNAQIIEALERNRGVIAGAAKALGCHRTTIERAILKRAKVAEAKKRIDEENLDVAEGKLLNFVQLGSEKSVHFFLRTRGRSRGYAERAEVTGPDGGPVETTFAGLIAKKAGR